MYTLLLTGPDGVVITMTITDVGPANTYSDPAWASGERRYAWTAAVGVGRSDADRPTYTGEVLHTPNDGLPLLVVKLAERLASAVGR